MRLMHTSKHRGKYLEWYSFHITCFLLNVYFVLGGRFGSINDAYRYVLFLLILLLLCHLT